jgi:NitT/TauT family transport system ATP-binding protein
MSYIEINNIEKHFSENKIALKNINLKIKQGEFICIFGPNGCGKSTLLNIISGIIKPNKGSMLIDGKQAKENIIGYVFQDYRESLLPWKTNLENIAFPLELRGVSKKERLSKAKNLVNQFDLSIPLNNYPYQSSGGEQQLVALLREILAEPKVILMDEPFSALHHESRNYLKIKVQELWQKLGLTIIFVSHDITETIQLADRIIIMKSKPGKIIKYLDINTPKTRTEESIYSNQYNDIRQTMKSHI